MFIYILNLIRYYPDGQQDYGAIGAFKNKVQRQQFFEKYILEHDLTIDEYEDHSDPKTFVNNDGVIFIFFKQNIKIDETEQS